jgi:hypothetical protein
VSPFPTKDGFAAAQHIFAAEGSHRAGPSRNDTERADFAVLVTTASPGNTFGFWLSKDVLPIHPAGVLALAGWLRSILRRTASDQLPRYLRAIAMPSSAMTSENRCETWASARFCPRRALVAASLHRADDWFHSAGAREAVTFLVQFKRTIQTRLGNSSRGSDIEVAPPSERSEDLFVPSLFWLVAQTPCRGSY